MLNKSRHRHALLLTTLFCAVSAATARSALAADNSCSALFSAHKSQISVIRNLERAQSTPSSPVTDAGAQAPRRFLRRDDTTLARLGTVFGPEVQRAREFDLPRLEHRAQRWWKLENMPENIQINLLKHSGSSQLFIRVPKDLAHNISPQAQDHSTTNHSQPAFAFFSIDSRLPRVKQIIEKTLHRSPPAGFTLSQDGLYFIGNSNNLSQPTHSHELVGAFKVDYRYAWPTPEQLTEFVRARDGVKSVRFTRTVDPSINVNGLAYYSHSLMQYLADDQVPVLLSENYGQELLHAHRLYLFTQREEWPKLQALIRAALIVNQNPDARVRDRYAAGLTLDRLFHEIEYGVYPHVAPKSLSKTNLAQRLLEVAAELPTESGRAETNALPSPQTEKPSEEPNEKPKTLISEARAARMSGPLHL